MQVNKTFYLFSKCFSLIAFNLKIIYLFILILRFYLLAFHQLMDTLQFPQIPPGVREPQFGKPWLRSTRVLDKHW